MTSSRPAGPPAPAPEPSLAEAAAAQLEALDALEGADSDGEDGEVDSGAGSAVGEDAEDDVEDLGGDDHVSPAAPAGHHGPGGPGAPLPTGSGVQTGSVDPLTAPLSLLTRERPELPEALWADEVADGSASALAALGPRIVLDPVWDTVPEPEMDRPEPYVPPVLLAVTWLGRTASAGILAVSVLAVGLPLLAWVVGALSTAGEADVAAAGAVVGLTGLGALLVTTLAFLAWVSRAHENVARLSPTGQRWSRGMAVCGWLIPVAGPFVGWQVLRDLWTGSDPTTRGTVGRQPEPLLVTCWLAGLAVASVVSLAGRFVLGGSPLVDAVAGLAVALSGACLVATVTRVSRWQEAVAHGE
jgi:hypothetical protein